MPTELYYTQGIRDFQVKETIYSEERLEIYLRRKKHLCPKCGAKSVSLKVLYERDVRGLPMGLSTISSPHSKLTNPIMQGVGIDSEIADKYYTHVSEESQRKAVEAISSRNTNTSQAKIDRLLKFLMLDGKLLDTTADSTLRQVLEILKGA